MGEDPDELLGRIGSRKFAEWLAYYQLEPFGEMQADYRAGLLAAMMANSGRDARRHHKAYEITDFYPWLKEQDDVWQNDEEKARQIYQEFRSWALMAGANPKVKGS